MPQHTVRNYRTVCGLISSTCTSISAASATCRTNMGRWIRACQEQTIPANSLLPVRGALARILLGLLAWHMQCLLRLRKHASNRAAAQERTQLEAASLRWDISNHAGALCQCSVEESCKGLAPVRRHCPCSLLAEGRNVSLQCPGRGRGPVVQCCRLLNLGGCKSAKEHQLPHRTRLRQGYQAETVQRSVIDHNAQACIRSIRVEANVYQLKELVGPSRPFRHAS